MVAGKTFSAPPDANLVKECQDEIKFFNAIDHPNCHYLLGAKTTLDHGGILMLTEVNFASTPTPVCAHAAATGMAHQPFSSPALVDFRHS